MWRVRTIFTTGTGVPYLATMFLDDVGGLTASDANAGVGAFWTALNAVMGTAYNWGTDANVDTVNPVTGQLTGITPVTPVTGVGINGADELPQATQGLVEWRTGVFLGGREVRGKTFIPGVCMNATYLGKPTTSYKNALQAAATTYASGTLFNPGVFSRRNGSFSPIAQSTVWTKFAVLRSRRQ
jgi:hypothetical protein